MLATLRRRLDAWTVIVVAGAAYLVSQIAIGRIVRPLGGDMLAVQTTLSADRVRAIFARWDAAGLLPVYAAHYRWDMAHPLWYAVLLAAMLAKGLNASRARDGANRLLLLPFVAGACDLVENLVHLAFLAGHTKVTTASVLLGNGAALAKWTAAAASLAAVAVLAVRARTHRP